MTRRITSLQRPMLPWNTQKYMHGKPPLGEAAGGPPAPKPTPAGEAAGGPPAPNPPCENRDWRHSSPREWPGEPYRRPEGTQMYMNGKTPLGGAAGGPSAHKTIPNRGGGRGAARSKTRPCARIDTGGIFPDIGRANRTGIGHLA